MLDLLTLLLAVAGALDIIAPREWKDSFARRLAAFASRANSKVSAPILVDNLFGDRLISFKAIMVSAILTAGSIVVMFSIPMVLNAPVIADFVDNLWKAGRFGFYALAIALVFTFIGDFFSYVQTRVFIRVIAANRTAAITSVMLLTDILASIVIFCLFFTIGRMIIYLLLGLFVAEPIKNTYTIAPQVIARAASAIGLEPLVRGLDQSIIAKHPELGLIEATLSFSNDEKAAAERIARLSSRFQSDAVSTEFSFVSQTHEITCFDSDPNPYILGYGKWDAYINSVLYIVRAAANAPDKTAIKNNGFRQMEEAVKSAFDFEMQKAQSSCPIKLLVITQQFSFSKMFSQLSPFDMYLGALSLTFSQSFDAIPSKFAYYVVLDLNKELPLFLRLSWRTYGTRFLGLKGFDSQAVSVAGQITPDGDARRDLAPIPLSTLLSSSLGASIFLWIVLLAEKIAVYSLRLRATVNKTLSFESVQKSIFLFIAATICLTVIVVATVIAGVSLIWKLLFSLLA